MKLGSKLSIALLLTLYFFFFVFPQLSFAASLPTEKQFTGHVLDSSSDLYYMRARYYDPVIGRFIQPDLGSRASITMNSYAYAENNPMGYIDLTGNQEENLFQNYINDPILFIKDILTFNIWCPGNPAGCQQIQDAIETSYTEVTETAQGLTPDPINDAYATVEPILGDPAFQIAISYGMALPPSGPGLEKRARLIYGRMKRNLALKHGVTVEEGLSRIQIAKIVGEPYDPKIYAGWHQRTPNTIYMVKGHTGPEFIYEEALHRTQWLGRDPNVIGQLNKRQLDLMTLLDEVEAFPLQEKYFERMYGYPFPYERVDPQLQASLVAQELTAQEISHLLSSYLPDFVHNRSQVAWLQSLLNKKLLGF